MHVYDANGNPPTHYDYDENGRLKLVTYPDKTTEVYDYDAEGHKTKFTDRTSHVNAIRLRSSRAEG